MSEAPTVIAKSHASSVGHVSEAARACRDLCGGARPKEKYEKSPAA
jgi:hypothetical protein